MKKLTLFLLFLFSLNANAAWREILCSVKFQGKVVDQSLIYVSPGSTTTTRLSVSAGAAEVFVKIDHKPIGASEITVLSENPSAPRNPQSRSKTQQQVKMAVLKTTAVSIPIILFKLGNSPADVECRGMR